MQRQFNVQLLIRKHDKKYVVMSQKTQETIYQSSKTKSFEKQSRLWEHLVHI